MVRRQYLKGKSVISGNERAARVPHMCYIYIRLCYCTVAACEGAQPGGANTEHIPGYIYHALLLHAIALACGL